MAAAAGLQFRHDVHPENKTSPSPRAERTRPNTHHLCGPFSREAFPQPEYHGLRGDERNTRDSFVLAYLLSLSSGACQE